MGLLDLYGLATFLLPILAEELVIGREEFAGRYRRGVSESPDLPPWAASKYHTGAQLPITPTHFSSVPITDNATSHKPPNSIITDMRIR